MQMSRVATDGPERCRLHRCRRRRHRPLLPPNCHLDVPSRPPAPQIRVKDGRLLVGEFTCLDKQGNIILTNTYEHMTLNGT